MADGLVKIPSAFSYVETATRLERAIATHNIALVAAVDHAASAKIAGLTLRPTKVFIFGSPKGGTPLMQAAQTIGIDLPLKALVYEDQGDRTWVAYNDPAWLAARHGVKGVDVAVAGLRTALAAIAKEATE
jgi:uncharacterized protein (DUF302 family)